MNILTITVNPAIDKNTVVDKVMPTKKLRCEEPSYEAGGGGINVSRAIKEMGGESHAIFLGGGPAGNFVNTLLEEADISHEMIPIKNWTRENLMIMENTTNQEYRFVMPGPQVNEDEWKICLDKISSYEPNPEYMVVSGSLTEGIPDDFYAKIAQIAKIKEARLIVDTSGPALFKAAEVGVFLLKPNLGELAALVGKETITVHEQEKITRDIVNSGKCEILIVSMGARGAMMVTKNDVQYVVPPTVKQHSTVGAGDSMVAGLIYALSVGKSHIDMLKMGVAAGTAATMTSGAELCHKKDVFRLYEWLKYRS